MKEISREEIVKECPEWPHGNVMLKTASFGENSKLASMVASIKKKEGKDGKEDFKPELRDDVSIEELNVFTLV